MSICPYGASTHLFFCPLASFFLTICSFRISFLLFLSFLLSFFLFSVFFLFSRPSVYSVTHPHRRDSTHCFHRPPFPYYSFSSSSDSCRPFRLQERVRYSPVLEHVVFLFCPSFLKNPDWGKSSIRSYSILTASWTEGVRA